MPYTESQKALIRENAIELYELLQEFFERYTRYHIITMDREFIDRVLTAINKCKGG